MAKRSYVEWIKAVNSYVWKLAGVGIDDLQDYCNTREWYEDGVGPAAAAKRLIRAANN